jgi:hypothetical protein
VFGAELTGGTLTSSAAGFVSVPSTASLCPSGRGWRVEGDRVEYGVVGTLLGPEGAGHRLGSGGVGGLSGRAIVFLYRWCTCGCVGSGGDVSVVSGCTLRTAQWTRASSDSD